MRSRRRSRSNATVESAGRPSWNRRSSGALGLLASSRASRSARLCGALGRSSRGSPPPWLQPGRRDALRATPTRSDTLLHQEHLTCHDRAGRPQLDEVSPTGELGGLPQEAVLPSRLLPIKEHRDLPSRRVQHPKRRRPCLR